MTDEAIIDALPPAPLRQRRVLITEMTDAWQEIAKATMNFREAYTSMWGKALGKAKWRRKLIQRERKLINALNSGL